jgi:CyaY protein
VPAAPRLGARSLIEPSVAPARLAPNGPFGYEERMTTVEVTEGDFERWADHELTALLEALDGISDELEADLESGILTLEFADGAKYVINSHRAARQIWMAAERNAWHFDPQAPSTGGGSVRWVATKGGDELWAAVTDVVGRKLGQTVRLVSPQT